MEISTFGFLGVYRFDDNTATRGALLITSLDTRPLEFRVTAPIRPQSFQSILYGELLEEYMAVELIGLPLLNEVERKPDLILVHDELLLGMSNKQAIPTIRVIKADEPLRKKSIETQILESLNPDYESAKFYTSEKFSENLPAIAKQLKEVFLERNLLEPFERLKKACTDIHSRKLGDK